MNLVEFYLAPERWSRGYRGIILSAGNWRAVSWIVEKIAF